MLSYIDSHADVSGNVFYGQFAVEPLRPNISNMLTQHSSADAKALDKQLEVSATK